ncbi:hypothetical protein [Mycobacterium nebraskense]|uniref:hypothetical protein n=1 Tax=Mycobacterium nebraskense TaxID=244292 RepID=UPI000A900C3C|nr:hypothetical protein [Mycobacterium nebraskense]
MSYFHQYTGTDCPHCGQPEYYQVLEKNLGGTVQEISRRGPSCWIAQCKENRPDAG